MKVLIVLKTNVGGLWIQPHVRALRLRGHDVVVVIPDGHGRLRQMLDAEGVRIAPLRFDFAVTSGLALARGVAEVRGVIRREDADVVMYHLIATALVCRAAARGLRHVRTVHMVPGPLYLESRPIAMAEAFLSRLDDHVIGGSEYTRSRYARLRYPEVRLSGIAYGVDTQRFVQGEDRRADLFGVSPGTFVAIMVAYVYAPKSAVFPGVGIKGHEVVLAAWRRFHARHPDSLLVIAGAGFDQAGEAHRRRLLAGYGDQAGVRWVETVEDVRPLYSSADVSVSPSLSENHGAAVEASAMGVPSIVSDAGGLPETVTPVSGWVVPAGQVTDLAVAFESAHADHLAGALRTRGQAARQHVVDHFDADEMAGRVVDIIEGQHRTRVLVVAEQRCGIGADGAVLGAVQLNAVRGIATRHATRLLVRQATGQPQVTELLPDATGVVVPWGGPLDLFHAARTVLREVRSADLTIVFAPGSVGTIGGLTALALRRPLAVVAVGDPKEALQPPVTSGLHGVLLRGVLPWSMRLMCRHADVVRYVTSRVLQHRYPTSGTEISASDAFPLPAAERTTDRGGGPLVVLTVASLDQPYKGVADLIVAMGAVRSSGIPAELVVVGSGRLQADLEGLAENVLGDSARFTGQLSREELVSAYQRADLFVLASWTEGMPRALLEAISHGIPCVATSVGGVVEVLPETSLAAPRDPESLARAIRVKLTQPMSREADRANASATVERLADSSERGHVAFVNRLAALASSRSRSASRTPGHRPVGSRQEQIA